MEIETSDLLGFAIAQVDRTNSYWSIYIAVASALLGVVYSGKINASKLATKIALSLIFLIFAFGNLAAILAVGEFRTALISQLEGEGGAYADIIQPLRPHPAHVYTIYHATLDLIVLSCIWMFRPPNACKDKIDVIDRRKED